MFLLITDLLLICINWWDYDIKFNNIEYMKAWLRFERYRIIYIYIE